MSGSRFRRATRTFTLLVVIAGCAVLAIAGGVMASERAVIFDQTGLEVSTNIAAQKFEFPQILRDCEAADDFTIGGSTAVTVAEVLLGGTYRGAGTAATVKITITNNAGGPGSVVCTRTGTVTGDQSGELTVALAPGCSLVPGQYWLVVQADMDFANGQWFWDASGEAAGAHARWRNPFGGMPTLCTDWGTLPDCFGSTDLSFVFALSSTFDPLIFADGFEAGNTSAWTAAVP